MCGGQEKIVGRPPTPNIQCIPTKGAFLRPPSSYKNFLLADIKAFLESKTSLSNVNTIGLRLLAKSKIQNYYCYEMFEKKVLSLCDQHIHDNYPKASTKDTRCLGCLMDHGRLWLWIWLCYIRNLHPWAQKKMGGAAIREGASNRDFIYLPHQWYVDVIKIEPSVCECVCVCLSVRTLTAEPFGIWSPNLVQELTLMTSWMGMMVEVKGQDHPVDKCNFWVSAWAFCPIIGISAWEFTYACTCKFRTHACTKSRNMRTRTNLFGTREVQQHFFFFVFFFFIYYFIPGERPYVCQTCGAGFRQPFRLHVSSFLFRLLVPVIPLRGDVCPL